jgi:hypothetical protein
VLEDIKDIKGIFSVLHHKLKSKINMNQLEKTMAILNA